MHKPALALAFTLAAATPLARAAPDKPAAGAPASASGASVADVVSRMQRFYESTADLHAKFDQENNALGRLRKAAGDVWLKKPGRMRWEYEKPEKKLLVADGKDIWVYEPEDEQAFKQSLSQSSLPSSVTFLFGTGRLGDEFHITEEPLPEGTPAPAPRAGHGPPGTSPIILKLVPKQPTAQYRYLYFVVDPSSYMVEETLVYDQQGGMNRMRFRDVETNKDVPASKFVFTPPAGTKVIKNP